MAAPIISVATQVPAELTAPNPVVASKAANASNQAFKSELNRAHEHAKEPEPSAKEKVSATSSQENSVAPSSQKQSTNNENGSEKALVKSQDHTQSDENTEKTVAESGSTQSVNTNKEEQLKAALVLENGKSLPSTGDQLPPAVEVKEQANIKVAQGAQVTVAPINVETIDSSAALIRGAASAAASSSVSNQSGLTEIKGVDVPLGVEGSSKADLATQLNVQIVSESNIGEKRGENTQIDKLLATNNQVPSVALEAVDKSLNVASAINEKQNVDNAQNTSASLGSSQIKSPTPLSTPAPTPLADAVIVNSGDVTTKESSSISAIDTNNNSNNSQQGIVQQNVETDSRLVPNASQESISQTMRAQPGESKALDSDMLKPTGAVASESKINAPVLNSEEGNQAETEEVVSRLPKEEVVNQAVNAKTNLDITPEAKANAANVAVQVKDALQVKESKAGVQENLNASADTVKQALPNATAVPLVAAGSHANSIQNEQTVSLNQYLEKMRAGVDSSSSEKVVEDSVATKASTAKITETLQQLNGLQNNLRTTNPVQMQMPAGTPPTARNWSTAVADKVFIAASQNLRVANIQLDPPELGALQIRLQVSGPDQQLSATFNSPHAAVRDALEQQLPRLREMLAEQGISLGESSVNDQGAQNERGSGFGEQQGSSDFVDSENGDSLTNPLNTQGTLSLVDFYA